jgi:hypothetical protein
MALAMTERFSIAALLRVLKPPVTQGSLLRNKHG